MPAPTLTFRNSAGVAFTAAPALTAQAGIPGLAVEIQITHDGGDALRNPKAIGEARAPAAVIWERDAHEWMSKAVPEARIIGGLGGLSPSLTGWTSIGEGSFLPLPEMVSGEGVKLEVRLDPPSSLSVQTAQLHLVVTNDRGEEVGAAVSRVVGDGICLPLRDSSGYALVYIGGSVVENPSAVDDQVQVPQLVWIGGGTPWGKYIHLVQLNNQDSAAAALAAGQAYKARLTLGNAGAVVVTKGVKATAASAVAPAWPADQSRLATVTRAFDALINNVDIEQASALDLFGWSSASLTGTVGAGRNALVDGSLLYLTTPDNATLQASATNLIYRNRDGSLTVSPAATPDPGSLLIHEAVTDASVVTTHRDRRQFIGYSPGEIRFEWLGALAVAGSNRYAHAPVYRDLLVLPCRGVTVSIGKQAITPASGATTWELQYSTNGGGAWTSLFPTAANRPAIAYNATAAALVGLAIYPEAFVIPAGALICASIAAIPAGAASPPEDGSLTLRFAI